MKLKSPLLLAGLTALVLLLLIPTSFAKSVSFQLDEPIVIGNQIYPSGELVLSHAGLGNLLLLEINGRHIGLMSNTGWGLVRTSSQPYLVLTRDEKGLLHLKCVRFRTPGTKSVKVVMLKPTALLPGLATVDDGLPPSGETIAVARR